MFWHVELLFDASASISSVEGFESRPKILSLRDDLQDARVIHRPTLGTVAPQCEELGWQAATDRAVFLLPILSFDCMVITVSMR